MSILQGPPPSTLPSQPSARAAYRESLLRAAPRRVRLICLDGFAAGVGCLALDLLYVRAGMHPLAMTAWEAALVRLPLLLIPLAWIALSYVVRGRALMRGAFWFTALFAVGNEAAFYVQGLNGTAIHALYFVLAAMAGLSLLPVGRRGRQSYAALMFLAHLGLDLGSGKASSINALAFDLAGLATYASIYFVLEAHFQGHRRQFYLRAQVTETLHSLEASRTKVAEAGGLLAGSAQDLDGTTRALSTQASDLRQEAERIAQTGERLARSADALAEQARTSAEHSQEAQRHTGDIDQLVAALTGGMAAVEEAVKSATTSVRRLEGYSTDALQFVEVIREISAQTSVLAFNAGLEAMHAGVHGRGFSVVAAEVRRLSAESGRKSSEVGRLVSRMAQHIQEALASAEHISETTGRFLPLLETARGTLNAIQGIVGRQSTDSHASVDEAGRQARDTAAISEAGARLRALVEAHARMSTDVATTVSRLAGLSTDLQGLLPQASPPPRA
ncbi:hypothetical protein FGE12_08340 [Aggregicoccus sp. 17bor-14]|uniref:methyl-accepting chemotaxis protein n=1 Tax=Myxococcaceae TaxID=31 RepID=UPI00129C7BA7|nr:MULTISPECIES: methyl-accepting chemotaxis protein [Myxococcaceae]MBF5042406.1 hypothetical protein [Simulacricoccus sp. 17bor-14]MRI88178.1 hypothetical protein [Aggregicoccus sp. 17bor-14]